MILPNSIFEILVSVETAIFIFMFKYVIGLGNSKCDKKELNTFRKELSGRIDKLEEDVKNIFSATNVNQTNIKCIRDDVHLILQRLQN